MMADVINLGQRVSSVDVSPQFQPYSKVVIHVDNDTVIEAGDNSGRVMEMDNPFGSQQMADNILARLRGLQYQPYQADGALLDPAAEIGDAVGTATSYGGLYTRSRKFGRLMKADISAPHDEEINHEYKYESPQERKFTRVTGEIKASIILTNNMIQSEVVARRSADDEMSSRITQTADSITAEVVRATAAEGTLSSRITQNADGITAEVQRATQAEGTLRSSLSIQASEIAAKVSASGGGGSFSWVLDSSSHTWKSNNTDVMRISASGLWIKGQVEATSGKIGGFDIGSTALQYNGLNWGDTGRAGVYVGQNGIQLGEQFRVDYNGNVSAANMTLSGTLNIGGQAITADALRQGAQQSYNNYNSWNGTTSTVNRNSDDWTAGARGGINWNNAQSASTTSRPNVFMRHCDCYSFSCDDYVYAANGFRTGYFTATWRTAYVKDQNGNNITLYYLGR